MNARTGLLTIGVLASISMFAASCGGGGSKPLTEDDFCTQKAGKECVKVIDSCSVSASDCQDARKKVCTDWIASVKAVAGTPRIFHPENVPACISKTAAVYAKTNISPADMVDVDDVCNYVFQGNVVSLSDTTCVVKYDCKDRGATICDKDHCANKEVKPANMQCADIGAVCPASQYCTTVGVALKCVDKKGMGVACDAATPCQDALRCSGGTCQKRLVANDKCCTDADCTLAQTGSGAAPYCNPYAGYECTNGLSFATHSPSCSVFGDTDATAATGTPTCAATGTGGMGGAGGTGGAGGAGGAGGTGGGAGMDAAAGTGGGTDAGGDTADGG